MGWIKDSKAQTMQTDAQKAWDADSQFFTPMLNLPAFKSSWSGGIADWPPMLEAIQSVGWKLHSWAVASDGQGRPQAMPLFIR